jgi:acyl carrier protein
MANEDSRVLRRHLALPQAYAAPRTTTERRLAEIWCAVLNMDCVGVDDDFTDLGGDSYSATVIFALVEEAFGVHLLLARLIGAPTIAALAREVSEAQPSSRDPSPSAQNRG